MTGTKAKILRFVKEMLDYQGELETKHEYEPNQYKKSDYADEIMSLTELVNLLEEYGYYKPEEGK